MMRPLAVSMLACCSLAAAYPQPASPPASEARYLTGEPGATDYWPCFSPDGKLVLFSRSLDGRKTWELFVVPPSGGQAHRLAGSPLPVSATRASWSRRINLIAFIGTAGDGKNSVWLIDADGAHARPLAVAGVSDRVLYPSWYPDGEHLAVMDPAEAVIKRIDRMQGTAVAVTDHRRVLTGMPSVSPDGKWIAFAGQKNAGEAYDQTRNSIWLLGEDGALRTLEPDASQGRTPAWSPDGRWLSFESNRGSSGELHAAFIIKHDGTGLRQVTAYELNANHPVWSPDGTRLVFAARHPKQSEATALAIIDVRSTDR